MPELMPTLSHLTADTPSVIHATGDNLNARTRFQATVALRDLVARVGLTLEKSRCSQEESGG